MGRDTRVLAVHAVLLIRFDERRVAQRLGTV
jgi:hypothetical protein